MSDIFCYQDPITQVVEIPSESISVIQVAPVQLNLINGNIASEVVFTGQTLVTVTHNLGYRPFVEVTNIAGEVVLCAINHTSLNAFIAEFSIPNSGTIRYQ